MTFTNTMSLNVQKCIERNNVSKCNDATSNNKILHVKYL